MLKGIFESSKDKWRIANLRYFNPIGAHDSSLIGENPSDDPNNLFPIICNVAQGKYEELKIFGNDWPTGWYLYKGLYSCNGFSRGSY